MPRFAAVAVLLASLGSARGEAAAAVALTAASFFDAVGDGASAPVFIGVFSPQCLHCIAMMPQWRRLGELVTTLPAADRFTLATVNASTDPELIKRLDIHGFPTLLLVRDGRLFHFEGERRAPIMLQWAVEGHRVPGTRHQPLPRRPDALDPLLELPEEMAQLILLALQNNRLAAAALAIMCALVGAALVVLCSGERVQFITVACPADVKPGGSFGIEFTESRTVFGLGPGKRRRLQVVAPRGIVPGQEFFVPLVAPPEVRRSGAPPRPPPPAPPAAAAAEGAPRPSTSPARAARAASPHGRKNKKRA